ncbi:unnamed protein product [Toxocara canis]|uniref:ULP_PROTEASE domain-containing protein n=1 Tax=Toxocara canis TaxID=6265 RepID=A0A183VAR4_TOXCA|nr:unnamed protein product [Toxocara canis]
MKISKSCIHESALAANISTKGAHVQRSVRGGCAHFKDLEIMMLDGDEEMIRIRFPLLTMQIQVADFVSLAEGALLNDTIIDFYLNHIVAHMLPDDVTSEIHVLPSLFWHRLRTSGRPLEEFTVMDSDPEACFSKECRTYVNFWVEKVDIFDADFIVIPIIEQQHWMLVIVCSPSLLIKSRNDADKISTNHFSSLIFFDSQQQDGDCRLVEDVTETVRQLFAYVFSRQVKYEEKGKEMFDAGILRCILPSNLPQQQNNVDCGLFILEYARCFLLRQPSVECLNSGTFDFAATYPEFHMKNKRHEIQKTILSLCLNAEKWSGLLEAAEISPESR